MTRASLLLAAVSLACACGDDDSDGPETPGAPVTVQLVYLAPTAPRAGAPAAVQACQAQFQTHAHPSWRAFAAVPLQANGPDRWEVTFDDVPPGGPHSFRINDPNRCDENPTGAITREVFANGVQLTRGVPTPGQGDEPGLSFSVAADGTVTP